MSADIYFEVSYTTDMTNQGKRWEILYKSRISGTKQLIDILLKNRGIKTTREKKEFLNPTDPVKISLKTLGIKQLEVRKAIDRIKKAKKSGEHVIIYGDYDADGITGTATLWETLHELGIFVLPHIPERFSEGYGLNIESVKKMKRDDPKLGLIVTVDHGIMAGDKVKDIKKMGIDMIITDHHQAGKIKPSPYALVYTTQIGGSALAWFLSREIAKHVKIQNLRFKIEERLQLAAIGTIADQLPLIGPNRSIVKYGLDELRNTKRPGLLALFDEARINRDLVGTYEVGFMIAPRINSMGRLKHGLESLRLLCTKDIAKAKDIARNIGETNYERQKIVDKVILHARDSYKNIEKQSIIVLAHESYHEGVIGLAAAKLVEEFYRPAIVLSKKGDISKASARSITGFNIIETIRKLEDLYVEGGGHPMAAGFSIETKNIEIFTKKINQLARKLLTDAILERKLKIDLKIDFVDITNDFYKSLLAFEPSGLGNPTPTFATEKVEIADVRTVGTGAKHLKLKLNNNEHYFDSIYFGGGENYSELKPDSKIDVAYQIEENIWNGNRSLQLKVKDIKLS